MPDGCEVAIERRTVKKRLHSDEEKGKSRLDSLLRVHCYMSENVSTDSCGPTLRYQAYVAGNA